MCYNKLMKDKKRRKDPGYQLYSTGNWVVSSPEAKQVLSRLAKKRTRREAWLKKQVQKTK